MKPVLTALAVICLTACSQNPAPLSAYGASAGVGSAGVHTVGNGDTVYSISKRYKIDMPEIIMANSLSSPFRLNVGQRLTLPPPHDYEVRSGDSLSEVARLFNVSQSRLAELNSLSAPYQILAGEVLRIPGIRGIEGEIMAASISSVGAVTRASLASKPMPKPSAEKEAVAKIVPQTFQKPGQFLRPVSGSVVSNYGAKKSGLHNDGINIAAPRGTPVKAAAPGQVVYAGNELKGYGNLVLVKHGGRLLTAYGHLNDIMVKKGDVLQQGQTLGTVGSSGQVKKPQLHFEIRKGTDAVDPKKYI